MVIERALGGRVVLIDQECLPEWAAYDWRLAANMREIVAYAGGRLIRLHRHIMHAPDGLEVDHINGNPLDNRRVNLRLCTHAQNMKNRKIHRNNSSGVKGIYRDLRPEITKPFKAQIRVDGKKIYLGAFATAGEAGAAYSAAAKVHHADFARV